MCVCMCVYEVRERRRLKEIERKGVNAVYELIRKHDKRENKHYRKKSTEKDMSLRAPRSIHAFLITFTEVLVMRSPMSLPGESRFGKNNTASPEVYRQSRNGIVFSYLLRGFSSMFDTLRVTFSNGLIAWRNHFVSELIRNPRVRLSAWAEKLNFRKAFTVPGSKRTSTSFVVSL